MLSQPVGLMWDTMLRQILSNSCPCGAERTLAGLAAASQEELKNLTLSSQTWLRIGYALN